MTESFYRAEKGRFKMKRRHERRNSSVGEKSLWTKKEKCAQAANRKINGREFLGERSEQTKTEHRLKQMKCSQVLNGELQANIGSFESWWTWSDKQIPHYFHRLNSRYL